MKDRRLKMDHITLGVCYYPEHWPEDMWQADLQEMKRCGIEVIRIAEFAWNKFEPQEGVYTFDFFDHFMQVAEKEGMKVIKRLCLLCRDYFYGRTGTDDRRNHGT